MNRHRKSARHCDFISKVFIFDLFQNNKIFPKYYSRVVLKLQENYKMFGRSGGLGTMSASQQIGTSLVEFKAGRMNMVGNVVHPDTRKGLVSLIQSQDRLIHFCWEDRTTGKVCKLPRI